MRCMCSCSPEHIYDDNGFVRVDGSIQHAMLQHARPFSCYQLLNTRVQTFADSNLEEKILLVKKVTQAYMYVE